VAETGDLYRAVVDNGVNDPVRSAPATLTVLRRPLQVTPDDVTVGYGTPPELTYTITGWVENPEQLDADPVCGVAEEHTAQGTYEITCSGGASPNYAFDYGTATLTVTPAHLTVTAKDQSTVYGSADPAFTFVVTGFLPGDEAAHTTPPTCGVAGPHTTVGTYAIHCGGAAAPGYEVTYVDGDLEVTSATLTVVADDATRPFGAANPPLTAHLVGFVNGDGPSTVHGSASCTSPAGPSTPIGTSAPITCTAGTLSAHDYSFAIGAPGHLTITAAPTVLVEHPTKVGLLGLTRTVSATLTRASDGAPLAGRRVSFVVGGAVLCTATTDAHGTASCSLFGLFLSLGRLSVTSTWAGDGSYVGTSSAPTSF
jgi:hypothetical protein